MLAVSPGFRPHSLQRQGADPLQEPPSVGEEDPPAGAPAGPLFLWLWLGYQLSSSPLWAGYC